MTRHRLFKKSWYFFLGIFIFLLVLKGITFAKDVESKANIPLNLNENIVKNLYVYLDASGTIVGNQENSQHKKIREYIKMIFDPESKFIGSRDKVQIIFFHNELNKGRFADGIDAKNFGLISQRLSEYEEAAGTTRQEKDNSLKTNFSNVLTNMKQVLSGKKLRKNEFNIFIIASDFVHDPENKLCRPLDADTVSETIQELGNQFANEFSANANNFLVLIPVPVASDYIRKKPVCFNYHKDKVLGGLKGALSGMEFQIARGLNDSRLLLEEIKQRMVKWIIIEEDRFKPTKDGGHDIELIVLNPSPFPVRLDGIRIKLEENPYIGHLQGNSRPWVLSDAVEIPASGKKMVTLLSNPEWTSQFMKPEVLYFYPDQNIFPKRPPTVYKVEPPKGELKIYEPSVVLIPGRDKAVQINATIEISGRKNFNDEATVTITLRDKTKDKIYESEDKILKVVNGVGSKRISFITAKPEVLNRDYDKLVVESESGELFATSELAYNRYGYKWLKNYFWSSFLPIALLMLQFMLRSFEYLFSKSKRKFLELVELFTILIGFITAGHWISLFAEVITYHKHLALFFPAAAIGLCLTTLYIFIDYKSSIKRFLKDENPITYERFTWLHTGTRLIIVWPVLTAILLGIGVSLWSVISLS